MRQLGGLPWGVAPPPKALILEVNRQEQGNHYQYKSELIKRHPRKPLRGRKTTRGEEAQSEKNEKIVTLM